MGLFSGPVQCNCIAFRLSSWPEWTDNQDLLLQKCADSGFCERLRGKQGDSYSVDPKSIKIDGAVATARVQHDASGTAYDLQLTNYNGILRMHIDEAASKHRFQVPWVLQSELPDSSQVSRLP